MNTSITDLIAFTIDCSDAGKLAHFYAELAGAEVTGDYPEYGYAQTTIGAHTINFQAVDGYAAPRWPGQAHPQQYHLDFSVADLDHAIQHATGLGATVAADQPPGAAHRVMLDPDGHPFCLCPPA